MKPSALFIGLFFILSLGSKAQVNSLQIDPVKETLFKPYMLWRHQGEEGLQEFKKNHPHDYMKELWYVSESFYVKRDHLEKGASLNAGGIDVTRFENQRKEDSEAIIILPGYRDALVLLPLNKLIYKPN